MKKVIKLTEADLEKLVQKIIREGKENGQPSQGGQQGEEQTNEPNPKDVENFMAAFNEKFIKKYPQYTKRISNKEERVMLVKAFADMLNITPSELNSAKTKM
jgi:hypothetical protein